MPYNDWSNQYTWTVNWWLFNDEGLNARAAKLAKEAQDTDELAEQLFELVQKEVSNPDKPGGLAFDLLSTALDEVDWHELARAWIRDQGQQGLWPREEGT